MPTYGYLCKNCGYEFEQFQTIKARPLRKCPACKKAGLKRLIGAGSGLIFKGPGFYATDYRSEGYKKASESETKTATPAKDAAKKGPETKAKEPKPSGKDTPGTKNDKKSA